jgi:hypothetical protein
MRLGGFTSAKDTHVCLLVKNAFEQVHSDAARDSPGYNWRKSNSVDHSICGIWNVNIYNWELQMKK